MRKLIILSIVILAGCSQAPAEIRRSLPRPVPTRASMVSQADNEQIIYRSRKTAALRGEMLERHLTGVEGVDKASVVVTGNTAIIGISLAGGFEDYSDRQLMRIKANVENEARQLDPELAHVAVTAADEFIERVNNLADPLGASDTPPRINPEIDRFIEELAPPV